jgi:hypothetical protein
MTHRPSDSRTARTALVVRAAVVAVGWPVGHNRPPFSYFKLQPFIGPTVYASEDEVEILSVAYGQRIIDEKLPGLKAG